MSWLVQTQTPLIALALMPLFVEQALSAGDREISPRGCAWRNGRDSRFFLMCSTHQFDHWFYLRFLLPAYPALFVLMAAAIRYLCLKLPVEARLPVALCVCAAVIPYGVTFGIDRGIFNQAAFERRHVRAAENVAEPRQKRGGSGGSAQRERALLREPHHAAIRLAGERSARCRHPRSDRCRISALRAARRVGRVGVPGSIRAAQPDWQARLGTDRTRAQQP